MTPAEKLLLDEVAKLKLKCVADVEQKLEEQPVEAREQLRPLWRLALLESLKPPPMQVLVLNYLTLMASDPATLETAPVLKRRRELLEDIMLYMTRVRRGSVSPLVLEDKGLAALSDAIMFGRWKEFCDYVNTAFPTNDATALLLRLMHTFAAQGNVTVVKTLQKSTLQHATSSPAMVHALMRAHSQSGEFLKAHELFEEMKTSDTYRNCRPTVDTFCVMMDLAGQRHRVEHLKHYVLELANTPFAKDMSSNPNTARQVFSSMAQAWYRCGDLRNAVTLVTGAMVQHKVVPSINWMRRFLLHVKEAYPGLLPQQLVDLRERLDRGDRADEAATREEAELWAAGTQALHTAIGEDPLFTAQALIEQHDLHNTKVTKERHRRKSEAAKARKRRGRGKGYNI